MGEESLAAASKKTKTTKATTDEHCIPKGKGYKSVYGLSRDTVMKAIIWLVPIIFMCGGSFYFLKDLGDNDVKHDEIIIMHQLN